MSAQNTTKCSLGDCDFSASADGLCSRCHALVYAPALDGVRITRSRMRALADARRREPDELKARAAAEALRRCGHNPAMVAHVVRTVLRQPGVTARQLWCMLHPLGLITVAEAEPLLAHYAARRSEDENDGFRYNHEHVVACHVADAFSPRTDHWDSVMRCYNTPLDPAATPRTADEVLASVRSRQGLVIQWL